MNADVEHSHQASTQGQQHAASITPGAATGASGTQYTCTMHPEVVRDAPGNCPKCGMTLVPM